MTEGDFWTPCQGAAAGRLHFEREQKVKKQIAGQIFLTRKQKVELRPMDELKTKWRARRSFNWSKM